MQITQYFRKDGVALKGFKDIFRALFHFISTIFKKIFILGIRFYQIYLSPLKKTTHCRFIPTCSQYAMEAIEKYGPVKGTFLGLRRILRCNPFSKGGCDPVP